MSQRVRETTGPVADAVRQMYAAYGNPASFDSHLHPDITIWETDRPGPLFTLAELDALRGHRAPDAPAPKVTLAVENLLVDRWGETSAVARYVLRAGGVQAPTTPDHFRATDVFSCVDGKWQIVHHHAEAVPATEPDTDATAGSVTNPKSS